jgi:hypothetical protein
MWETNSLAEENWEMLSWTFPHTNGEGIGEDPGLQQLLD